MFMAHSREAALLLSDRVEALLHRLGLQRNPKKGRWESTQVDDHLGLTIDLQKDEFRANIDKMQTLARQASKPRPVPIPALKALPALKPLPAVSVQRPVATLQRASSFRRQGSVSLPRHRANSFLSTRTPFRVSYATRMGRTSPHDTPTKAGPRVVADNARPTQRTLNLQTNRDGVPPRGLQRLRMRSCVERQPQFLGPRILVQQQPTKNASPGRSYEPCALQSSLSFRSYEDRMSSCKKATQP
jgi:hypothetical protein